MQVYSKLCERELLGYKQQQKAADLTTESLKDKSSHVRRNAIKLLTKLVLGNLFSRDDAENGGLLATEQWVKLLEQTEREIEILDPPQELPEDEETVDASLLQDATQVAPEEAPRELTEEERNTLQQKQQEEFERMAQLNDRHKKRKWLLGALKFIGTINRSAETVTMLLSSKNKNEVIDAMDFFTTIDAYKLTTARAGIKKMLRLIWTKGNSDDGKSIQTHLIECYRKIFFVAPDGYSSNETAIFIANNMISLTFGTTPAELTSLEQLLSTMMKQGLVSELVIQKLWIIYGYQKKEKSMRQKRGAIIVLGMLALAKPEIITAEIDVCLRVGLGEIGRRDLLLARYTCIALKRISPPPGKKTPDNGEHKAIRFPEDHPVLARLASIIQIVSDSQEWFGLAEQALSAIYVLAKHPDVLCSDILKRKTKYVFGLPAVTRPGSSGSAAGGAKPAASSQDAVMQDVHAEDQPMEDVQMEDAPMERVQTSKTQDPAIALAQLLFIVGHVAIKQIVHLGLCEQEHNRREAERKKKQPTPRASLASEGASSTRGGRGRGRTKTPKTATPGLTVDDELDAMAGKDEDEFKDRLETVREFELLYAHNALLAQYGPLVRKICANKRAYNHPTLQAQAALCLAKLMCVSKRYCEENLITFLKLVQGSEDPIVRSNLVVGLGDICICFEETVEKYMDLLYERLTDRDSSVKRACLMTLSFLMLAARIKVGGKELGNIAKCLEDSDKMFVDMARTFFSELATKDKAVYSNFQNIFSLLSADSSLDEEAFRRIIKYIAGFIEKVSFNPGFSL
jgi:condensin complex subunit 1